MTPRVLAAVAVVSVWFGCQCGTEPADACASTRCGAGLTCDTRTGRCVAGADDAGAGGGTGADGGASMDAGPATCVPACSAGAPLCDVDGRCKVCTATTGCGGGTPACWTTAGGGIGACVQCVLDEDCPITGATCDPFAHTCMNPPAGGGSGTGGGSGSGAGGGGSSGPPLFDDAGVTSRCGTFTGPSGQACQNSEQCPRGYECVGSVCVLRGRSGPVQVTLRWGTQTDLDLYLVEPLLDGGTCEIYYGRPGPVPCSDPLRLGLCLPDGGFAVGLPGGACGSKGWLDLDANRGCDMSALTSTPVENIIYSPGVAVTSGTYTVRVNNWSNCSLSPPIPWEVEVRANGQTRYYCGQFQTSGNAGASGAGDVVTSFTLP